jgi:multiple sugar transport system permease protein
MNMKVERLVSKSVLTAIMIFFAIIAVMPFLWMFSSAFKPTSDVFEFPIRWIPRVVTIGNFITVWEREFYIYYTNSLKVAVVIVVGEVITSALAGYAFAKIKFKGRNVVFLIYVATLIFPHQMLLVPRFVLYRLWGMYNTLWALMLPGIFTAFGTFLFKQFFTTIPDELIEASKIEGCNHFQSFWRVILGLSGPVVSTLIIFSFVSSWNNYENALVFLGKKSLFTIPLGLLQFILDEGTDYGAIMAASVLSMLPIFIIFIFLQKYFIQGIAMTGMKG